MTEKKPDDLARLYANIVVELGARPDMSLEEVRDVFDHWGDVTREPGGVDYSEAEANGIPVMWAVPKGCAQDRVLLCTHGGGYVVGSMYSHRKMFAHIAKAVGCRALIVHFRRAPENLMPGPVEDTALAYEWLLDQGIRPEHIAFAGDSAGGSLAVSGILRAREKGLPLPAASLPMSPFVDPEAKGGSYDTNGSKDALVTSRHIIWDMAKTSLGEGGDARHPLVNPSLADLRGFPPMHIQVGGDESLLDDSIALADRARADGVDVTLEIVPGMQHVFQFLAGRVAEADDAIARMAAWVRPKLGLA